MRPCPILLNEQAMEFCRNMSPDCLTPSYDMFQRRRECSPTYSCSLAGTCLFICCLWNCLVTANSPLFCRQCQKPTRHIRHSCARRGKSRPTEVLFLFTAVCGQGVARPTHLPVYQRWDLLRALQQGVPMQCRSTDPSPHSGAQAAVSAQL